MQFYIALSFHFEKTDPNKKRLVFSMGKTSLGHLEKR